MADDKRIDVHPDVLKAVEMAVDTAVSRRLEGMNILDLKKCREELEATQYALKDMQQNFALSLDLARARGEQSDRRSEQINALQAKVEELQTEIALLRSALENKANEVRPGNDE